MWWNFWLPGSYWQKFSLTWRFSVAGQKEKGKPTGIFFFHKTRRTLKHIFLKDRSVIFFFLVFKKVHRTVRVSTETQTTSDICYADTQKKGWIMSSGAAAFSVGFPVFHKLSSKRFWPLLFITISALPLFAVAAIMNRTGQHRSNNSHGSIQQRWQHFLEVDNQSAQSYCVITQKVEPWDLIWASSAALSPVSFIQKQIKGQHLFAHHGEK